MINFHRQYQTQLELERVLLLNKLQTWAASGPSSVTDPVSQQLREQTQAKLARINQARTRLNSGQFGLCQVCGQPIDPERLEAIPYAELCINCQRQVEHRALSRYH